MFRLTHYLEHLTNPQEFSKRKPKGPVVIWNLLRRCNLACRHCYANSYNKEFEGELNLQDALVNVTEMKKASVPAVILSGGEPLLHPHLFEIAAEVKKQGFFLALSSNGVLLTEEIAEKLKAAEFNYVGISLDGIGPVHDHIRGEKGAFEKSLQGVRNAVKQGLKVGLRTTLTHTNYHQIEDMLNLCLENGVSKFYLSHLNYGGRGNKKEDAHFQMTRKVMELLFEKALEYQQKGIDLEIVTGNNDADAGLMLLWAEGKFPAANIEHVKEMLEHWGGNASGIGVANIDSQGDVHPDSFWPGVKLGSIKDNSFADIWSDSSHPVLQVLRGGRTSIHGRCRDCRFFSICHGNTRARAQQMLKDPWASDPGCYLTDDEIKKENIEFTHHGLTKEAFC